MDSKKFAWIYLIEHGIAGHSPAFYGGYDLADKRLSTQIPRYNIYDLNCFELCKKLYLTEIKAYGIDWNKSIAPSSDMISRFNGTFAESTEEEYLTGVLVLNNGTKQHWTAEKLGVSNVFDMMAKVTEYSEKAKELGIS